AALEGRVIVGSATRGPVTASLEVPESRVTPGSAFTLVLTLALAPGVRIGSVTTRTGRATTVQLGFAEGLTPGAMVAPQDSVDPLGGERVAGYAGTVAFRIPVTVAPDCLPGAAPFAAKIAFEPRAAAGKPAPMEEIEVRAEVYVTPPA
ncbi:MAG TPA: hypothetical protein VFP58_12085, partial [Candidatus Eisenbacteria bacterium]|nr:hypothetical protein [Candidatus Eisenbacteria bacterium]